MKSNWFQLTSLTLIAASSWLVVYGRLSGASGIGSQQSSAAKDSAIGGLPPKPEVRITAGDEAAINRALASLPSGGGRVLLDAGIFEIRGPVVIDRDDAELRGRGRGTVLRLAPGMNCPVIVIGSTATPVARIVRRAVVADLMADGSREAQGMECCGGDCDTGGLTHIRNNGITIRGAEDILVQNVITCRARSGGMVLEKNCRRVLIDGLESFENHFDGLAAYETEDSVFSRMNLHHNRSAALSFDIRFHHNVIQDSLLACNGSQGIFMRDSCGNLFRRLSIRGNGMQGVFIAEVEKQPGTACTGNRFEDTSITANLAQGIRINDASCTGNSFTASRIERNRLEDISLASDGLLAVK